MTYRFSRTFSTRFAQMCLLGIILVWAGFLWMPGKDIWGFGPGLLVALAGLTGWIGIVLSGRVSLFAKAVGQNLIQEQEAVPTPQTGKMSWRDIFVTYLDPLWAGGVGYVTGNLLATAFGGSFGIVPSIQALISDVTGFPKVVALYTHHAEGRITVGKLVQTVLTLGLLGVASVGLAVPFGNLDRGIQIFACVASLNTTAQFLVPALWYKFRRHEALNGRFWIHNMAGLFPVILGISFSAVCGVALGTYVHSLFTALYPKEIYGGVKAYAFAANFAGVCAQEALQSIVGGIGVQLLLSRMGSVFFPVLWVLIKVGAGKFWGMITLRGLRHRQNPPAPIQR